MAIDQTASRSRRAVLAAGLGGLAATVASAIGRPGVARAADQDPVYLAEVNQAIHGTRIDTSLSGEFAFSANATGSGPGVSGSSDSGNGVIGYSNSGTAVYGTSSSGTGVAGGGVDGVYGVSSNDNGVHGVGDTLANGVRGESTSHYGVYGSSGTSYGVYGTSASNAAIYGESTSHPGVVGHSDNTIGVSGISPNGSGVYGSSGVGVGVVGSSNATNQAGVRGSSGGDSTGVVGYSGSSLPATAPAKTGLYGLADQDATSLGVYGKSTAGRGVYGEASNGQGVRGYSASGAALYGSTGGPKAGYALGTDGRVRFDKSSGLATILSGTKSVVVTPGIDLTSTSAIVATLQGDAGPSTTVQRVAVDTSTDKFTIYLNANASANVKVAWHVFG